MAAKQKNLKIQEVKAGTATYKVPFSNLRIVEGFNVRMDYGDIKELAKSIQTNGVKVPVRGYRDKENPNIFYLVDGHRRYRACELLHEEGIEITVPFIVEPRNTGEEQRIVDMVITNTGKPLNPLELAEAVRRLLGHGWDAKEIGERFGGLSAVYINRLDSLNNAPKKFTNLILKGQISSTFAMDIIAKKEVDSFMETYKDRIELNEKTNGPTKKITKKEVNKNKIDSWKFFKHYSTTADASAMQNCKREAFELLMKISLNEATAKDISEFFEN